VAELGDLGRLRRVVKLLGMVNCTEDFTRLPHYGMAVEVEGVFEVAG
jgi:hypothetical protein